MVVVGGPKTDGEYSRRRIAREEGNGTDMDGRKAKGSKGRELLNETWKEGMARGQEWMGVGRVGKRNKEGS